MTEETGTEETGTEETGTEETGFMLHERLAADCVEVVDLELCKVLLMNDSRFPWLILVPRRADIRELMDLDKQDQRQLLGELDTVGRTLQAQTGALKMNFAALGNMVPQLHWHVIARFDADEAWPGPVWGVGQAVTYSGEELAQQKETLRAILAA